MDRPALDEIFVVRLTRTWPGARANTWRPILTRARSRSVPFDRLIRERLSLPTITFSLTRVFFSRCARTW